MSVKPIPKEGNRASSAKLKRSGTTPARDNNGQNWFPRPA